MPKRKEFKNEKSGANKIETSLVIEIDMLAVSKKEFRSRIKYIRFRIFHDFSFRTRFDPGDRIYLLSKLWFHNALSLSHSRAHRHQRTLIAISQLSRSSLSNLRAHRHLSLSLESLFRRSISTMAPIDEPIDEPIDDVLVVDVNDDDDVNNDNVNDDVNHDDIDNDADDSARAAAGEVVNSSVDAAVSIVDFVGRRPRYAPLVADPLPPAPPPAPAALAEGAVEPAGAEAAQPPPSLFVVEPPPFDYAAVRSLSGMEAVIRLNLFDNGIAITNPCKKTIKN